jgi:hypothetical protein
MATKDISDADVCRAFALMMFDREETVRTGRRPEGPHYADEHLSAITGQPLKVCYRAMERALRRELVDYGMWLKGGWLTESGIELLSAQDAELAGRVRKLNEDVRSER